MLLGLFSCSTTHIVGRPVTQDNLEQLESDGLNKRARVDYVTDAGLQDSPDAYLRRTPKQRVKTDSIEGVLVGASLQRLELRFPGYEHRRISFSDVRRIRITDQGRGAVNGLFYGILAGAAAGALGGAVSASTGCTQTGYVNNCPSASSRAAAFGLGGGIVGGLLGLVVGSASGYQTTFVF